jgi:serine/threonine-protein phosphatase 2A regulatory subunit B'
MYTDEVLNALFGMVHANLFRSLPPKVNENPADAEDDDPVFDPSFPHIQSVYEFFLRFIVSSDVDVRVLKKYVNVRFVRKFLILFDSEDHRERDYLKTILHRVYAKYMSLRSYIRKAINNVFFTFIYDSGAHNGVGELLEILGSIITGFALPLKQEHKHFLHHVLLPMHKIKGLQVFHQQLSYCVTQFVDKDPTLSVSVCRGFLKFWPAVDSQKEVLYISELEELLEITQAEEFRILIPDVFKQLAKSIGSAHFQVAERSLLLWHNEYISGLIADHRAQILPIIYPQLNKNSKKHWNPAVSNLTISVLKIFMELDSNLVEACSKKYNATEAKQQAARVTRQAAWATLAAKHGSTK